MCAAPFTSHIFQRFVDRPLLPHVRWMWASVTTRSIWAMTQCNATSALHLSWTLQRRVSQRQKNERPQRKTRRRRFTVFFEWLAVRLLTASAGASSLAASKTQTTWQWTQTIHYYLTPNDSLLSNTRQLHLQWPLATSWTWRSCQVALACASHGVWGGHMLLLDTPGVLLWISFWLTTDSYI